jgi:thiol reductant ABC exporter CydC subunit
VAAAGALAVACGIGLLATSGWLITRASERPPVLALSIAIGSVQAFALGRGVARYCQRLGTHGLSLDALGTLRLRLYDAVEPLLPGGLPTGRSDEHSDGRPGGGTGQVVNGFVADAELVGEGFAKGVTAGVDVTASIVLGAVVAALVEPVLGALLATGATIVVVAAWAGSRLVGGAEREARVRAELADTVVDTMGAARELVAYGRQDLLDAHLEQVRRRSVRAAWQRSFAVGAGRAVTVLLSGGALLAVVGAGLAVHDAHRISGVMLAVVVFVALAVFDQLASVPAALADVSAADASAASLRRLEGLAHPVVEPGVDHGPLGGPPSAGLDGVEVVRGGTVVLDDVTVRVPAGGRVALVGPSGSGKSSALLALLHFVACARGRATLDGADVAGMTRQGIARRAGWMPDHTYVFAASLGDNLRIARRGATDAECRDVLDRVGLSPWVETLRDGLATAIGEGGRPMSAGERARLGLARALLTGGGVLLLDEPTAHVDPASASRVLADLLDTVDGRRAVLVVSHDRDVADLVDTVVALDHGRVAGSTPRA